MLDHAWIIPLIPALSFALILAFGKKLPYKGAEIGITALGVCFALALVTNVQWFDHVNDAEHAAEAHATEGDGHAVEDEHAVDEEHAVEDDPVIAEEHAEEGEHAVAEEGEHAEEGGHTAFSVEPVRAHLTWWQSGGVEFSVGMLLDGPAVMMLFVVTLISLLVHIYSTDYVGGDRRYTHYFAFLSLFTASMLGLIMSENTLQLLTCWELVGLCSFALIGHWWEEKPNSDAALKAFITNRVGDVGLICGVIILYFGAGQSFDIVQINEMAVSGEISHLVLLVGACSLLAAVMSKSGQFILHTWLPDAMAGPTPVSALIHAATMVVAGIFMVGRLYGVFFQGLSIGTSSVNLLAIVGGITVLGGAGLAFVQNDIKKVLAYSTVSQLGYMVMALGVGAWTAAFFHLFTHAMFKAGLFLGSGSVAHSVHSFDMKEDMGGMKRFMPNTYRTFLVVHGRPHRHLPAGRLLVEGRDPRRRRAAGRLGPLHGVPGRGSPRRLHDRRLHDPLRVPHLPRRAPGPGRRREPPAARVGPAHRAPALHPQRPGHPRRLHQPPEHAVSSSSSPTRGRCASSTSTSRRASTSRPCSARSTTRSSTSASRWSPR